jgi:hypothetical protein
MTPGAARMPASERRRGYCSLPLATGTRSRWRNVVNHGIQVLIPPDAGKRKGTRPGWDGGAYAHMRRVLQTDFGRALYRKRQAMIEPVFGQTKHARTTCG